MGGRWWPLFVENKGGKIVVHEAGAARQITIAQSMVTPFLCPGREPFVQPFIDL